MCVALAATSLYFATPAGAATAKFDCDTAAKRFSEVALPVTGQHLRVSGVLSARLIRNDSEWAPKLAVYVSGAEKQMGGFSISKQPGQPWTAKLLHSGNQSSVAVLKRFDPLPFTLDVDAMTGRLNLRLGSNEYRATGRAFQAEQLRLSCSTGNFMFDQLSWEVLPN